MNRFVAAAIVGLLTASFSFDAEAQRRLGGGRSLGKQSTQVQQRQATPPRDAAPEATPAPTPAQQTAARPPAGAPVAASPWKGALLGLAAGLGLAALASHLGLSETLTAVLTAALLGFGLMLVLGFLMRRGRSASPPPAYPAYAGAGRSGGVAYGPEAQPSPVPAPLARPAHEPVAQVRPGSAMDEFSRVQARPGAAPWGVPEGFDVDGFLANARSYFGRLQAAWDRADLRELQEFTTQDMFVALTHELRARTAGAGTQVRALDATLLGIETAEAEYVASVRFTGSLHSGADVEQIDEVWNLSKAIDGRSGWLLAGIQQLG
jgi:predicted lipid-binding transport protein (Tim44 family)